jgi:hypothetical protein
MHITIAERAKPMGFCNTYVGGTPGEAGVVGSPAVSDVSEAVGLLDDYEYGMPLVTSMSIDLRARRGLSQANLLGVRGPHTVRRGHDYRFKLLLQRVRGAKLTRTVTLHVSRGAHRGFAALVFKGTAPDTSGEPSDSDLAIILGFDSGGGGSSGAPRSIAELAHAIAQIHRYDGVTAELRAGRSVESRRRVFRDPDLRVSGTARLFVRIRG